jgi:Zn-dependent protease
MPFFAILALLSANWHTVWLQAALWACLFHECGHLCMMSLLGQPVRQITCYGVGIRIKAESHWYPLWQDGLVLLAGPVCNLLLAGCWFVWKGDCQVVWAQLGTGLLNLLPFRHLDGGAAIRLFLPERWENRLTVGCVLLALCGILYGILSRITNITYYGFLLFLLLTEIF